MVSIVAFVKFHQVFFLIVISNVKGIHYQQDVGLITHIKSAYVFPC